ncbi:MAG: hypothetical protein IMF09_13065 [Proteobacteria bacterium]|nr:hypothetical protein [Pseudomonadota bacterium]
MFSNKQYKLSAFLLLVLVMAPLHSWAQTSVGCDDDFVTLAADALRIEILPTGGNDTVNIQCGLEAAVSRGFLLSGSVRVTSLYVMC